MDATEYLVILTVETQVGTGIGQASVTRLVQVKPGQTRADLLAHMRQQLSPEFSSGAVSYFYAERNAFGGAA